MKNGLKFIFITALLLKIALPVLFANEDRPEIVLNPYPVPEIPYKEPSLYADFFENNIFERLEKYLMFSTKTKELLNILESAGRINAFDEVPDSALFTNRNGKERLTLDQIKRGPDVGPGPVTDDTWVITKGKGAGRSPGFFMVDSTGEKYLIKLDRKQYPEMITSCEVIGTKLFHAIGYNVPQNTICYFSPEILTVAENATYYDSDGFEKKFTLEKALTLLEENAYRNRDGQYRAVASKLLDGVPKGYVSFRSSRSGDENDRISHFDRREMRAYQVFSAWLNHHDARRGNTLDMLIEKDNGWYLKQYLIDFGSCLGSHNMKYKYAEAGHTYVIDFWEVMKSWFSLGFYKKPYHRPVAPYSPAVGYITSDVFHPGKWKPMIPNLAFDKMTNVDAFWAAKIVMSFTDDQIRAGVDAGGLSISRDSEYLVQVIIARRDKIGRYWFSQVNPLDTFELSKTQEGYVFSFENLYKKYDFLGADEKVVYEVDFIDKDDAVIKTIELINTENCVIPSDVISAKPSALRIRTIGKEEKWQKAVSVFLDEELALCGITREN
jgi:hypothetical protein